jgi:plastocyanin domain-containing protein
MLRMCWAPVDGGYTPEMIVVRAGAQTGAVDQAFR